LDSFSPVRDSKRILFFVSFVLLVVKYPFVCSSMIRVCFTVMNHPSCIDMVESYCVMVNYHFHHALL